MVPRTTYSRAQETYGARTIVEALCMPGKCPIYLLGLGDVLFKVLWSHTRQYSGAIPTSIFRGYPGSSTQGTDFGEPRIKPRFSESLQVMHVLSPLLCLQRFVFNSFTYMHIN